MWYRTPQLLGPNKEKLDIYSALLRRRVILFSGPVNTHMAAAITASLMFLDSQSNEDIFLYINSDGGETNAMVQVYDTMQGIHSDIQTYCVGHACSAAALILCAGTPGKRFITPSSYIMVHEGAEGFDGKNKDFRSTAKWLRRFETLDNKRLARHTGLTLKQVVALTGEDRYIFAQEARALGFVDKIIKRFPKVKRKGVDLI